MPDMPGYRKPKVRLHREFVYLNHDTVLNSLSAVEAGMVDEIIEKTSEARDGGLEASVAAGPVRGGGSKKKTSTIRKSWFGRVRGSPHLMLGIRSLITLMRSASWILGMLRRATSLALATRFGSLRKCRWPPCTVFLPLSLLGRTMQVKPTQSSK